MTMTKNEFLNADGSTVNLQGTPILSADEKRAELYKTMSPIKNEVINEDGSTSKLVEISDNGLVVGQVIKSCDSSLDIKNKYFIRADGRVILKSETNMPLLNLIEGTFPPSMKSNSEYGFEVSAPFTYGAGEPFHAVDDRDTSYWSYPKDSSYDDAYILIKLPSVTKAISLRAKIYGAPTSVAIETSIDGITFERIYEYNGVALVSGEFYTYDLEVPKFARFIRYRILANGGNIEHTDSIMGIYDIKIIGVSDDKYGIIPYIPFDGQVYSYIYIGGN